MKSTLKTLVDRSQILMESYHDPTLHPDQAEFMRTQHSRVYWQNDMQMRPKTALVEEKFTAIVVLLEGETG